MTPGPFEPTGDQLQQYLKHIVDDLLMLYNDGILVPDQSHASGFRRLRVALIGLICDHPAMCKVCGFADKNHNEDPCTKCKATKKNMYTDEALRGSTLQFSLSV